MIEHQTYDVVLVDYKVANFSYDRLRESAGQGYELNEVMERSCLEISVVLTCGG